MAPTHSEDISTALPQSVASSATRLHCKGFGAEPSVSVHPAAAPAPAGRWGAGPGPAAGTRQSDQTGPAGWPGGVGSACLRPHAGRGSRERDNVRQGAPSSHPAASPGGSRRRAAAAPQSRGGAPPGWPAPTAPAGQPGEQCSRSSKRQGWCCNPYACGLQAGSCRPCAATQRQLGCIECQPGPCFPQLTTPRE